MHNLDFFIDKFLSNGLSEMFFENFLIRFICGDGNYEVELPFSEVFRGSQLIYEGCEGLPMFLAFDQWDYDLGAENLTGSLP